MLRPSPLEAFVLLSLMLHSAPSLALVPPTNVELGAEPVRVVHTHVERQHTLRQGQAWQSFVQGEGQGWQATFDEWTGTPRRAWGPGLDIGPVDSEEQVIAGLMALVSRNGEVFQVDAEQLSVRDIGYVAETDTWLVHLDRMVNDVPVWRGGVDIVIKQGKLIMMGMDTHPSAGFGSDMATIPSADAIQAARNQGPAPMAVHTESSARLVLLPVQRGSSEMRYRLVWETRSTTDAPVGIWVSMVDANSGDLVAYWNEVRFIKGNVSALHHERNPGSPLVESPVPWAPVYGDGGTTYTDVFGNFDLDGSTFETEFDGSYLDMRNDNGPEASATFSGESMVWDDSQATQAEIDTYVFLHHIQDWGQQYAPSISIVSSSLRSTVNINEACNAFYNGNVNFYLAGSGCNNTGEIADVAYHEWGHGFHYTSLITGSYDGDMGEGIGDVVAVIQTDDPVMARYFMTNGSGIRELDTDRVYPEDYQNGNVHANGLMFGGSAWDLLKALEQDFGLEEARDISSRLLAGAVKQGPTLTSAYDAYVAADDDNADLGDGTPHLCYLLDAFTPHGLGPGGTNLLIQAGHDPVENQTDTVGSYSLSAVLTNLAPDCTGDPESAELVWSTDKGESWDETALTLSNSLEAEGELPGQDAGTIVHYYMSFEGNGEVVHNPSGAFINPHSFLVGETETLYFEDFENGDGGFVHELVSGDETQGADDWWAGTPAGLNGDPAFCFSGDTCWGNDLGGEHEGATWNGTYQAEKHNRLSSPAIEIPEGEGAVFLQFRRWLNVEDGKFDTAQVLVDGEPVWSNYVGDDADDHLDTQWALETIEIEDVDGDGYVTISWDLITDGGKELAGWTLDDVAVLRMSATQDSEGGDSLEVPTTITAAGSCGCASTSPNPGMLFGFFAVLGGLLLRRRRS
jgi:MYXO-CTERM domain-containing protein